MPMLMRRVVRMSTLVSVSFLLEMASSVDTGITVAGRVFSGAGMLEMAAV